jgi:hypothetical protein
MSDDIGVIALIAIAIAMAVILWEMQESSKPVYRKDCNECSAAKRRQAEVDSERVHDIQHRGVKAPGMPAPTDDRWDCDNPDCTRNCRYR